jgi:hypothetical protein
MNEQSLSVLRPLQKSANPEILNILTEGLKTVNEVAKVRQAVSLENKCCTVISR